MRPSFIEGQIELVGKALDTIEALVALNSPDADAHANDIAMKAIPGILKTVRNKVRGPGRDVLISTMEGQITHRLTLIGSQHGVRFDTKPVAEGEISTDPRDWMLK